MTELHTKALVSLLEEAYEGSKTSFFSDSDKPGLLGTLAGLSAEQASKPLSADGLTTAAHAEHLRWSLANLNSATPGGAWNPDWKASWRVRAVSAEQWDKLRSELSKEYQDFHQTMSSSPIWHSETMMFTGVVASIAHAAYHLGAIRAMLKQL